MKTSTKLTHLSIVAAGATLMTLAVAPQVKAINLTGWAGVGNYGTLGADGAVTLSPTGDPYGYVSTAGGISGVGLPGVGGSGSPTNGSTTISPFFSANAGDSLKFYFNYVTSDGAGFADYAWGALLNTSFSQVALLFTARTTSGGDTAPGFSMPPLSAALTPASTPIIPGGPVWSPLAGSSGACFSTGCGYTGWIEANYIIPTSGIYALNFGAVNWNDTLFDSGLAFDGTTINGEPIAVPEPLTILGAMTAAGFGAGFKRKLAKSQEDKKN